VDATSTLRIDRILIPPPVVYASETAPIYSTAYGSRCDCPPRPCISRGQIASGALDVALAQRSFPTLIPSFSFAQQKDRCMNFRSRIGQLSPYPVAQQSFSDPIGSARRGEQHSPANLIAPAMSSCGAGFSINPIAPARMAAHAPATFRAPSETRWAGF